LVDGLKCRSSVELCLYYSSWFLLSAVFLFFLSSFLLNAASRGYSSLSKILLFSLILLLASFHRLFLSCVSLASELNSTYRTDIFKGQNIANKYKMKCFPNLNMIVLGKEKENKIFSKKTPIIELLVRVRIKNKNTFFFLSHMSDNF